MAVHFDRVAVAKCVDCDWIDNQGSPSLLHHCVGFVHSEYYPEYCFQRIWSLPSSHLIENVYV